MEVSTIRAPLNSKNKNKLKRETNMKHSIIMAETLGCLMLYLWTVAQYVQNENRRIVK